MTHILYSPVNGYKKGGLNYNINPVETIFYRMTYSLGPLKVLYSFSFKFRKYLRVRILHNKINSELTQRGRQLTITLKVLKYT